jgi:hypothetical protein
MGLRRAVLGSVLSVVSALTLPAMFLSSPASADQGPQEIVYWSGLQGTNGVVSQDALVSDTGKPFAYVSAGQLVNDVAWLGPAFEPAPDGTVTEYWQINCYDSAGNSVVVDSPQKTISVPGSSNSWQDPPVPTLFVSQGISIPPNCAGSGNASISQPDGWVYMCVIDQDPPDDTTGTYCDSTAFGMLAPGATPPGAPFPAGTTQVYRWVSPSELSHIQATGHFDPAPNSIGEWFYSTYESAENAQNNFKGFDLVVGTAENGSLFDYSVGVVGALNIDAYFIPANVIESLYDVTEVAGGG